MVSTSQQGKVLIMKEGILKYLYRQRTFCRKPMQSDTLALMQTLASPKNETGSNDTP